jgi:hypothetical protein
MSLIDCLLMTLLSAVVCICLPRVLALLGSSSTHRSWDGSGEGDVSEAPLKEERVPLL